MRRYTQLMKGGETFMTTHRIEHGVSSWAVGFSGFAGALMVLAGIFQAFEGLTAIFTQNFYVVGHNYLFQFNVTTWGWIHLIIGSIIAYAGVRVFSGRGWARGTGIFLAILSALANFFYIPYYPIWSLVIIALNIAVIWALASYNEGAAREIE
jgi:hypothetical protein